MFCVYCKIIFEYFFQDLRKDRTALGVLCFLVTTTILTFVDILCVGVYIGLILWLLYFTFLKDCLEISIFAIAKCVTRLKWLYRIFKIRELLYTSKETNGVESIIGDINDCIRVPSSSCLVQNSPDTPSSIIVASSSCSSKPKFDPSFFNSIQSGNSLQTGETRSPALFQSPLSSKSGSEEFAPRKLSSLSTHIITSTEDCNFSETNFEDVDLSDEKTEIDLVTPAKKYNFSRSPLKWNISKMKIFDSFRKNKSTSPVRVKTQLGNIAAIATGALPQRADDNEKLISDKKDSPEQVGCCTSFPHLLRAKYQSSLASYSRF